MKLHELTPVMGARKNRKRVGRGSGSGHGTYSCRGCKGNKSRAGWGVRPGFEGGQLPLIKRLPEKRGFVNNFKQDYSEVNLKSLNTFESGSEITADSLLQAGLINTARKPVKVLAMGDIDRPLTVRANKFSAAAKAKIEAAGGIAEEVAYAAEGG